MFKRLIKILICITFIMIMYPFETDSIFAASSEPITLTNETKKQNMYPAIDIIKDRTRDLMIEDVVTDDFSNQFIPAESIEQKKGFFEVANWLRFDIKNDSDQNKWLLEFAFPLIHELQIYTIEDDTIKKLYESGSDLPFSSRDMNHRYFVYDMQLAPNETKTFYALAVGSGDLHPPITLWDNDAFIEKTQKESILLGIFYGIIFVMILYNLFLYFGLRMKSYLYYVLVISFTLLGKLSINGIGFQYLWPNVPAWNTVSASLWVSLACIFILIFTRHFLDADTYIPSYKVLLYSIIPLNMLTIIMLPLQRYIALYLMVIAAIITFAAVLTVAIICLIKGAHQARFYIIGWVIFLSGVSITILERAVILPYSIVTEYAGQVALTAEVVLLSLALADKINIMRKEKIRAEKSYQESKELAIENLKKADILKDEFLAVTSHELRTPLYGMIGIAESLHDGITGEMPAEVKSQLSMIVTSGQRLTQLVNEILDFSKLKYDALELQFKAVHINSVLHIVLAMTNPLLKAKPIQLVNHIDDSLPPVWADGNRLQQILHNLIDNAIKYTAEGVISITATADNKNVTIEIADTGQGISEEQLQEIFQPFQQGEASSSRETNGVGIGLSITKRLIDLHDGEIDVKSSVNKGSVFRVTLPVYTARTGVEEVAVATENIINEESKSELFYAHKNNDNPNTFTILVADDEVVNLQVLMNQLSLENYNVLTALQGEDVFPIIEEHDIDLLILDIMMPGMSGYEVCQILRESYSLMELPILMLTAKDQIKDKLLSFDAGANDYLVKPCDKQELLSRVKTLVRVKSLNQELVEMNVHLEEKVLERTYELHLANESLQEMEASRRQFLADIAHELGTPVTLVYNYIQSLQQGLITITDEHYRKLVNDKIKVLNRLIEDLFDLSILESGRGELNISEIPVNRWLEQINSKFKFTLSHQSRQFKKARLSPEMKNYTCFVDHERMDQLFSNLISNAIKHTEEHTGEMTLRAELLDSYQLLVEVNDNGYGINKKMIPHIFERFYKHNKPTGEQIGTGLGLAIVKQIVKSHEGYISVESNKDVGTTFFIILPIHEHHKQIIDQ